MLDQHIDFHTRDKEITLQRTIFYFGSFDEIRENCLR